MNTKKVKAMRRHFRAICKRTGVQVVDGLYDSYLKDLKRLGMYDEFLTNSSRYRTPNMMNNHNSLDK